MKERQLIQINYLINQQHKEDGLESTGYTMTQADLNASKQKQSNAEKVKEISNNPANEIEVVPTSTSSGNNQETAGGQQSADSGEASSIPALKTSNDGNEYRMLFSHTYQQG